MSERGVGGVRGRVWGGVRVTAAVGALAVGVAACSGGGGTEGSATPSASATVAGTTVAPADFGSYGGPAPGVYPGSRTLSVKEASLVGPHFAVRFDRVSFTRKLNHMQAMNFIHDGGMNMGMDMGMDMDGGASDHDHHSGGMGMEHHGGGVLKAASGYEFMILHTVTALPDLSPVLPAYKKNNAPEDKVAGEIRVGEKTVRLPGIVRDLTSDHNVLVSVPVGGDPVLAITDEGRTQSLNLRTGHRMGDAVSAYY